jgi:Mg-chelatase subunit ChlD
MYASPEAIRTCMLWVNDDISARGTTDIMTPLVQALHKLQNAPRLRQEEIRMPVVFLLTDGGYTVYFTSV